MGVAKSVLHMYTYNQYLYWYIEKGDAKKIEEILAKRPNLINQTLTLNSKTTALHRCAYNGNFQLVKLLVQKYKADINKQTDLGETALVAAAKRNKIEIIRYFIEKGADVNFISTQGLKVIDYPVLGGYYQASQILYQVCDKQLKSSQQYSILGKQYKYRYVNYQMFLEQLKDGVPQQNCRNFLKRQKKILQDPVIDPRQTWKQWLKRQVEFNDPPLVQRSELPAQLQPQNQRFGKIKHFFGKMAMSPLSQKPSFKPQNQSQFQQTKNILQLKKIQEEQVIQSNSVS